MHIGYTIYIFEFPGTDYGICCWYTPQLNYSKVDAHTRQNKLSEPDWGTWFMNISKVYHSFKKYCSLIVPSIGL